jgi:hypothetical protein
MDEAADDLGGLPPIEFRIHKPISFRKSFVTRQVDLLAFNARRFHRRLELKEGLYVTQLATKSYAPSFNLAFYPLL